MDTDSIRAFTPREQECLALVSVGYRSREIGARLGLSAGTVDNYIKSAAAKAGVADRKTLARRFAQDAPQLVQSLVQRLDVTVQPLAEPQFSDAIGGSGQRVGALWRQLPRPVPTRDRPTNTLSRWERNVLIVAIAIGSACAVALLVGVGRFTIWTLFNP